MKMKFDTPFYKNPRTHACPSFSREESHLGVTPAQQPRHMNLAVKLMTSGGGQPKALGCSNGPNTWHAALLPSCVCANFLFLGSIFSPDRAGPVRAKTGFIQIWVFSLLRPCQLSALVLTYHHLLHSPAPSLLSYEASTKSSAWGRIE
jgi:hypothetical protein